MATKRNKARTRRDRPKVTEFAGMITTSPEMVAFFETVRRVAKTDVSALIRGETGTGKEMVAKAIHTLSVRSGRPFLGVNCATFTLELLASELFGHVRGAFTGAVKDRAGLFARADGGGHQTAISQEPNLTDR